MTERELLEALTVDDPWCTSQEGLGDGCHFCGGWRERWNRGQPWVKLHEGTCDWMAAMDYLGRAHPGHDYEKEME